MEQYSLQELGARVRSRNPQAFGDFTDEQIGQRVLERKPELQNYVKIATPTVQPEQKKSGFLAEMLKGAIRPFARVGVSEYNLAESLIKGTNPEQSRNLPFLGETKPLSIPVLTTDQQGKLKAAPTQDFVRGLKESIGTGAEIGTTIAPVGRAGGLASKVLQFGAAGAGFEAGRQMEQGENINGREIFKSALLSGALPAAGPAVKKIFIKPFGKAGAAFLGKTTGTSGEVIEQAFKNPNVMKFAKEAGKDGGAELMEEALNTAKSGLQKLRETRRTNYLSKLNAIKQAPEQLDEIGNVVRNKAKELLAERKIAVVPQVDDLGRSLNKLDFTKSTIVGSENIVEKALNEVLSSTDNTAIALDTLKKRLGDYIDQIPEAKGPAKTLLIDLQDALDKQLKSSVKGYSEMTAEYAKSSQLIKEIQDALSLGDRAKRETAIKKLMTSARQNNESRRALIEVLEETMGQEIQAKIAGAQLSSRTPRGLAGALSGPIASGAGAGVIINPSSWPLLFFYIALSSPKLVGDLASITGQITRQMVKANKFTPAIENAVRLLLQQAIAQNNK